MELKLAMLMDLARAMAVRALDEPTPWKHVPNTHNPPIPYFVFATQVAMAIMLENGLPLTQRHLIASAILLYNAPRQAEYDLVVERLAPDGSVDLVKEMEGCGVGPGVDRSGLRLSLNYKIAALYVNVHLLRGANPERTAHEKLVRYLLGDLEVELANLHIFELARRLTTRHRY